MSDSLSIQKLANATIRNRAEYSQLHREIKQIDKEKRNELKMLNNEKMRFKAKYAKANFNSESNDASNVKMYETHNPGFCFKRNGEHRIPQMIVSSPPVDFEHLQFLLFTNGEVDIEKVLCLHLLSSHETEHLTQPKRLKSSVISKKDSPLEQLIERSKEHQIKSSITSVLPTYVLDVNKENVTPRKLEDDRLSERLIINEKILELITTVMTALEQSNPEKVQDLITIADDPSSLKRIFRKPHIQEFIMTLKDHTLVNSCSSFILTQPTKAKPNHIEIRTATGALEDLVKFIRSNVLQFPNRNNWKMLEEESREMITIQNSPPPVKKNIDARKIRSPGIKGEKREIIPEKIEEEEIIREEDGNRFRRKPKNFVAQNIAAITSYKRSDEEASAASVKKQKRSSVDSKKIGEILGKKNSSENNEEKQEPPQNKRKSTTSEEIKYHIKQTTCPACMQKWKTPLPSPKVSNISKNLSESTASSEGCSHASPNSRPLLKTNSIQRLSILIEREQFTLDSYDRRYSNLSNTSNLSHAKKKKGSQSSGSEAIELNVRDLEKIRQAVREKEAKKKLEKFLGAE